MHKYESLFASQHDEAIINIFRTSQAVPAVAISLPTLKKHMTNSMNVNVSALFGKKSTLYIEL